MSAQEIKNPNLLLFLELFNSRKINFRKKNWKKRKFQIWKERIGFTQNRKKYTLGVRLDNIVGELISTAKKHYWKQVYLCKTRRVKTDYSSWCNKPFVDISQSLQWSSMIFFSYIFIWKMCRRKMAYFKNQIIRRKIQIVYRSL